MIKAETSIQMPIHQRRMQLLKVRKTGAHGDLLQQLKRMMAVTEWKSVTTDKMLIHRFSKQSDGTMSREAREILASPNPTVAALRTRTENSSQVHFYRMALETRYSFPP